MVKVPVSPVVQAKPKVKRLEKDAERFFEELEQRWSAQKNDEVVNVHDRIVMALNGLPKHSVLIALKLYERSLIQEIHEEISKQLGKQEQPPKTETGSNVLQPEPAGEEPITSQHSGKSTAGIS